MSVIAIPKILTDRLTEEGAKALAALLNELEHNSAARSIETLETKFEKRLAEEIGKFRAEVIKWLFIFLFGQYWMLVGTMHLLFKK